MKDLVDLIVSNYIVDKINPEKWVLKSDSLTTQNFTAKISVENSEFFLTEFKFCKIFC